MGPESSSSPEPSSTPAANPPATGAPPPAGGSTTPPAAQPASETTPSAPKPLPVPTGPTEAQLESDWFKNRATQGAGAPAVERDEPHGEGEQDDTAAEPETPAGKPQAVTPPVHPLTEADKQVLKRHQLDEGDVAAMPPAARIRFLANLEGRAAALDRAQQENAALRKAQQQATPPPQQQAPQQGQPPQGQPAPLDGLWRDLAENVLGEDGAKQLRSVFDQQLAAAVQPYQQQLQNAQQQNLAIQARVMADDWQRALEKLELPEGVDKKDPAVLQKLWAETEILLNAKFDWNEFNITHALPLAASTLYRTELAAADKARKAAAQQKALRGSVDPGTRTPTTAPPLTEEDMEKRWHEGSKKGLAGAALRSYVRAGISEVT